MTRTLAAGLPMTRTPEPLDPAGASDPAVLKALANPAVQAVGRQSRSRSCCGG